MTICDQMNCNTTVQNNLPRKCGACQRETDTRTNNMIREKNTLNREKEELLEQIQQQHSQLEVAQNRVDELEQQGPEGSTSAYQNEKQQRERTQQKLEEANRRIEERGAEIRDLKHRLENENELYRNVMQQTHKNIQGQVDEHKIRAEEAQIKTHDLETELAKQNKQMTAVQNINDRMAPQHAQCEQRNKLMRELETNVQELRASVKNLRKRNGQIESASTRRVGRYVEIQNELDEIREHLRLKETEGDRQAVEIADLKEQLRKANANRENMRRYVRDTSEHSLKTHKQNEGNFPP